ncbi:MAG: hypothetical protein MPEBLZ_04557, partial [Candidatus Methanoperedens nitroreducens]
AIPSGTPLNHFDDVVIYVKGRQWDNKHSHRS